MTDENQSLAEQVKELRKEVDQLKKDIESLKNPNKWGDKPASPRISPPGTDGMPSDRNQ